MKKAILIAAVFAAIGARAEEVYDFQFQKAPEARIEKPAGPQEPTPSEVSGKEKESEEAGPRDRYTHFATFAAYSMMDDALGKIRGLDLGFQWTPFWFFGLNVDTTLPTEKSDRLNNDMVASTNAPVEVAAGIILTPFHATIAGRDLMTLSLIAGGMTYQGYVYGNYGFENFGSYQSKTGVYGGATFALNFLREFGIFAQYRQVLNDSYMNPNQLTAGMVARF